METREEIKRKVEELFNNLKISLITGLISQKPKIGEALDNFIQGLRQSAYQDAYIELQKREKMVAVCRNGEILFSEDVGKCPPYTLLTGRQNVILESNIGRDFFRKLLEFLFYEENLQITVL